MKVWVPASALAWCVFVGFQTGLLYYVLSGKHPNAAAVGVDVGGLAYALTMLIAWTATGIVEYHRERRKV